MQKIFCNRCLLIITILASGCAEYHFNSEVPEQYESVRFNADVKPGITTRKELQEKLGHPFINDEILNVSVYKVLSGHDVMLMGPIIPVVADVEDIIVYALITYDPDGLVQDVDWGLYHEDEGYTRLEASGFNFVSYSIGRHMSHTELLLAPLENSQKALHEKSTPDKCLLFVTPQECIGDFYCAAAESYHEMLLIDAEPLVDHPVAYPGFFKLSLHPGVHELAARILVPGFFAKNSIYFRRKFTCESGKSLYATPYIQVNDSGEFWDLNKHTYQGEILMKDTPWIFQDLQQYLYYAGKWFNQ